MLFRSNICGLVLLKSVRSFGLCNMIPPVVSEKSSKYSKADRKLLEKERKKERRQERKRSSQPDHHEILKLSEYYFENGLRKVRPYYYTFETYTKRRWVGEKLFDVLALEFHDMSHHILENSIQKGNVLVNGELKPADYRLKDGDLITNKVHRHEMPVLNDAIEIVHEDEKVLVVNKPASIPIHPCGKYNLNSMLVLLAHDHNKPGLRVVHRLDRMTSGLTIFGKDYDTALKLISEISARQVEKEYVCIVDGLFPSEPVDCRKSVAEIDSQYGLYTAATEELNILGKEAWTTFRLIRPMDDKSSLVHCSLHTGRTHQIRVHLQYLGYPIINDPLYNIPAWGPEKGTGGRFHKSMQELIHDLRNSHQISQFIIKDNQSKSVESSEIPHKVPKLSDIKDESKSSLESTMDSKAAIPLSQVGIDPNCLDCQLVYRDPTRSELMLHLHALRYKGPDWEYSTDLPAWARTEDG